jgi:hypothetical protein
MKNKILLLVCFFSIFFSLVASADSYIRIGLCADRNLYVGCIANSGVMNFFISIYDKKSNLTKHDYLSFKKNNFYTFENDDYLGNQAIFNDGKNNPWGIQWDCTQVGTLDKCAFAERDISNENIALICEELGNKYQQSCRVVSTGSGSGLPRDVCSGSGCSLLLRYAMPSYLYLCGKTEIISRIRGNVTYDFTQKALIINGKMYEIKSDYSKDILNFDLNGFILNGSTLSVDSSQTIRLVPLENSQYRKTSC